LTLGNEDFIKGWDLGLLNMCAGEKRNLRIPPHLAYKDKEYSGPTVKIQRK
jgi:FKBP-type peptidyl-prolyl cis-trans isomerase